MAPRYTDSLSLQNLLLSPIVWLKVLWVSLDVLQLQSGSGLLGKEVVRSWEKPHRGLTASLRNCLCSSPHPGSLSG